MNYKSVQIIIFILILVSILFSKDNKNKQSNVSLQKPTETSDIWLDANRFHGVFRNNGIWHYDVVRATQGTEWPAGSGNSPIFASGQWIAAKVNGEIKVAGIQHSATEFQAGEIDSPGVALNPKNPEYRWYELRSDGIGDWHNWPTDQGAPLAENGEPLLIGDQTIFSVWNDLADHAEYGTNKLSVEVRQTAFVFDNFNVLGDVQFVKWQLVNKSGEDWDSTYFTLWQDADLGDASDDLVGCDTALGLAFTYNATNSDQTYGTPPPAVGMDFVQGPIVDEPESTVIMPDGTILQNKKMLQMTCFVRIDGYGRSDNPSDGDDVWGYMKGFWRDGSPITYGYMGENPPSALHPPTKFMFSGDPESQSGWLDYGADDRRFIMITGSFPMAAWTAYDLSSDLNGNGQPDFGEPGVQEIVAAVMVAQGNNNLNSVTVLKEIDQLAEIAYRQNFKFVTLPDAPNVQVSELPNEIVLAWDERSEYNENGSLYDAEDPFLSFYIGDTIYINNVPIIIDDSTYNFFGYTVYQYSSIEGDNPVVYDRWDIGEGKDPRPYTETRYIKITENKNSEVGTKGAPLINGKEYYFSVVAESFNEFGNPKYLNNDPEIFSVTPRVTPGITGYSSQVGDTVLVEHLGFDPNINLGKGEILVLVVDPSKTTGDDYRVTFSIDAQGNPVWHLHNMTSGDTLLKDQKNQRGDDAYTIVDGLLVKVISELYGFTSFECVANANGHINPPESAAAPWQYFPCPTGVDPGGYITDGQQVGTGQWMFHTGADAASSAGGLTGPYATFIERSMRANNMKKAVPYDWEMRFTAGGSWAVRAYEGGKVLKVPFELWNIGINTPDDPGDDYRLIPWFESNGSLGNLQTDTTGMTWQLDPNDHPASGGDNDPYTPSIYWRIPDEHIGGNSGEAGYQAFLAAIDTVAGNEGSYGYGGEEVIASSVLINWNGDDVSDGSVDPATQMVPEVGTIFRFVTTKPNTSNDYFTFTAPPAAVATSSSLKEDMQKIKVVPNPYYGLHSGELSAENRWVQFTYLPPQCTVRIFTLAGHVCRKLEKNDPSTPFLKWDMRNEHKLPVGSGVYVYHIDAPGIGEKIGKIIVYSPDYK